MLYEGIITPVVTPHHADHSIDEATFADVSALEREVDFRPRTKLSEGIPRFVAWYRARTGL